MSGARKRVTLEEVAAHAGVGRGTVSRVINGAENVSPETRELVERAVAELNYVPNHAARSLAASRTDSIALVIAEPEARLFSDPFFAGIIRGITSELTATGRQLLLTMAGTPEERANLEGYLSGGHVDGVLLLSQHRDDPLPGFLVNIGVPTVQGGRSIGPQVVPQMVDVDNHLGAHVAVGHLLERGRRKIATISGPIDMIAGLHRLGGYREALMLAGLPEYIAHGDFTELSGARCMRELLERAPDLDAVFAASDLMAVGALRVLAEAGRRVPQDVAVVGFDDSSHAQFTGLSSVHQPIEDMGREMVRLLTSLISGLGAGERPSRAALVLTPHLVIRESS
ncbi:LacI family DNA-binding transcriptional regulator [Nonomuraea sp. NPDC059023]|uniref:LacI family DNA-binding transcriptional regulator n=1 Tax=unclassified Nonomuraea TaxID=2593643 RepID=UPI00368C42B6